MSAIDFERPHSLRERIDALYFDYAEALDEQRLDDWVALFTDDATYRAISAENSARGLPLATIFCDGRGMLVDRATAIRETMMYAPRTLRHILSGVRVREGGGSRWRTEANFLVVETIAGEETRVHSAGRYHDQVVEDAGTLRFLEKVAVYDSSIVPISLVFPL